MGQELGEEAEAGRERQSRDLGGELLSFKMTFSSHRGERWSPPISKNETREPRLRPAVTASSRPPVLPEPVMHVII